MSQLKRKSSGGSPNPDDSRGDAPNKRAKVDGSAEPEEPIGQNGRDANGHAHARDGQAPDKEDTPSRDDKSSPDVRRPSEPGAPTPSPRQERRSSQSRRRRSSSYARSPDHARRPEATGRRSRSPLRSPDQDRRSYSHRRRDASPPRRARRESETSRRDPDSNQSFDDNERIRRRSLNKEEEKKRGKRLFGGLLSTLSQTTTNSQQKRRQEIEKRQQEKAARQKVEDDLLRNERLAKLDRARKIEQIRFDEQAMRTSHPNLLAMARSLHTKSEPRVYYRPWELTPEQEDTIKGQIRDAQARIDDELQQFKRDKAQRLKHLEILPPSSSEADAMVGEPVKGDPHSNAAQDESAVTMTNDREQSPAPAQVATEDKDQGEMVEAEEDTVIY